MSGSGSVRLLTARDLDAALELSTLANWNQTRADWEELLAAGPDCCWGIDENGRLVSSTTYWRYDERTLWLGMVLTRPESRGRGYARRLMEHALQWADEHEMPCVKLDATSMGEPLYRTLGFRDERPIERWVRAGSGPGNISRAAHWRPGRVAAYFGPYIGREPQPVLQEFLAQLGDATAYWDLFPEHPAAELAREHGFSPVRRLLRMGRGECAPQDIRDVWAINGFERG